MTTFVEGRHAGEFVLSEGSGHISRDNGTVASGQGKLAAGTVLAIETGKYVAAEAGDTAVAILFAAVDATSADAKAVVIARSAEVAGVALTGLVTAHRAQLADVGIVVR